MKILWIGGLSSLLMIAAYAGVANNPGGVWATLANKHMLPFGAAKRPSPLNPAGKDNLALTPADYVFLHKTRSEGAPETVRRADRPAPR